MVYRVPPAAPQSQVPPAQRGMAMGRFCLVCASLYPEHRAAHKGQPVYGRDHIASPCTHEGELFAAGETWWEPAVEVLPAPAASAATAPAPSAAAVPAAAVPAAAIPATAAPAASAGTGSGGSSASVSGSSVPAAGPGKAAAG